MSAPVPAPRSQGTELKKPIPTPRKSKPESPKPQEEPSTNTFSRRVRSLSNASRQIAEDIGEMVQDKKKAVIEGTRQSMRRITKKFNSYHQDQVDKAQPSEDEDIEDDIGIFRSISFESPINSRQGIYNNIEEEFNAPPPSHPPPPLPDEAIYDAPPSTSGSTTSTSEHSIVGGQLPQNYESVFPVSKDLSRSSSWRFYDPVTKLGNSDNIYNEIGAPSTEISDLNSNVSDFSFEVRNSVYENHAIVSQFEDKKWKRPSESVILQFDPLSNVCSIEANETTRQPIADDIKLLEDLLQGDLYGNISTANTLDDWSISNDSEPDEFLSPPPPPVRFDSLPEEEQPQPSTPKEKSRTSWFTSEAKQIGQEVKKLGWLKQVKEVLEKAPEVVRGGKNRDSVVQRPELEVKSFTHKKGMLYKVQNGPVEDLFGEYSGRWCVLQNSNLICYSDNTCETIKEHFPADSILSVQILQDPKFKYRYDNDDLHCFELNTTGKSRGGHIYGAKDVAERRIWMQLVAESLTKKFSVKITTDYTRMGWAYIREGVSGKWVGCWILLSRRNLHYAVDNQAAKTMDLRKARCILLQVYQENDNNPRTNDKGPNMVVDTPNLTLYLRMWTSRETKVWCHIVKLAAHNNGANLNQQQLTKNDIPVLVEKCINFIYAHGSMTEGIYRKPGTGTAVSEILSKFRKDAWDVQLTSDKYSEHDVATALKRFFRDLPEPLFGSNQRQYLHQVSLVKDRDDRIRMYKAAFDQLPPVSYKTGKKLLGHLHFVASQSERNLMNVDNLASLWGPTLLYCEDKNGGTSRTGHEQDVGVVNQLISLYRYIFPEDPSELEQEKIMLQVLEKYTKAPQGGISNKRNAGDFRVWIYINNKEGQPVNVAIGPNKTAYEVCAELCQKMNLPVHQLILEEVVLNDKLTRPVHHTEKVLDIILRWGYWDDNDRKDNHLVITQISKYFDFIQDKISPVSGELKFADSRSKNFKLLTVEFSQAKLISYKDRTCEVKLNTWNVEEILWYLGHESKRNPQSRWSITFFDIKTHPKRTKSSPYFGNVLVWTDPHTRAKWLSTMLKARYQESLTPPALHVNLMAT